MKSPLHQHYRILSYTALVAVLLVAGCAKKAAPPPPPPQPPPPAPVPTVTLQASPTSIQKGDSSTLSWSSTNATQISIAPDVGPVTAEGSTKISPGDSVTYTITASGPGGSQTATASVTVTAPPPPPPPVVRQPSMDELFAQEVKDAYFDFNKADVRPDARAALSATGDFLKKYPQVKVVVEGHCDERGSTEYNIALGDRRAAAAKQFLVSLGVPADQLTTVSYGKEKPFCSDSNEDCWQQNRRAHFVMAK